MQTTTLSFTNLHNHGELFATEAPGGVGLAQLAA